MPSNYIPQIDYTSRDYAAIRDDMVNLIPSFLPEWTNTDASDFGITLIELFAYMGDLLNYYIDRSANEGFLATATQRSSVLSIASLLGYTPNNGSPAKAVLTFTNTSGGDITVPARTQVATTTTVNGVSTQVVFETDEALVVPHGVVNTASVSSTEGTTVTAEALGAGGAGSDGTAYQTFTLKQSPVITGSIEVTVGTVKYEQIEYLIDANSNDPVYTVSTDADGLTSITFGDNISGRIPPITGITATYRVGGGIYGNVGPNTLTYPLTNIVAGLRVTNQEAATGGSDPETTDTIRYNAPNALITNNRAVSLADYGSLAISSGIAAKAVAKAVNYNNVTLYIAPKGDLSIGTPGVDSAGLPNATFTAASQALSLFFTDKMPPTTTLVIHEPTYIPLRVEITLTVKPKYKQATVKKTVESIMSLLFDFDNVVFGDEITQQYLYAALYSATSSGLDKASITTLCIDGSTGLADIQLADNQIPVLTDLVLTLTGGIE